MAFWMDYEWSLFKNHNWSIMWLLYFPPLLCTSTALITPVEEMCIFGIWHTFLWILKPNSCRCTIKTFLLSKMRALMRQEDQQQTWPWDLQENVAVHSHFLRGAFSVRVLATHALCQDIVGDQHKNRSTSHLKLAIYSACWQLPFEVLQMACLLGWVGKEGKDGL